MTLRALFTCVVLANVIDSGMQVFHSGLDSSLHCLGIRNFQQLSQMSRDRFCEELVTAEVRAAESRLE
jgi:hypothetical protein